MTEIAPGVGEQSAGKAEKYLLSLDEFKKDNIEINGLPLIEDLGEGSAALTFLSYLPDGQSVAVKVGRRPVIETPKEFLQADTLLQRLHDITPFVPNGHGSGEVNINGYDRPYYVMDFVDGRTLTEAITGNDLSLEKKFSILRGVGYGLDDLLQEGYMPGDLRPDNIMLRRGTNQPVLTDLEHMNKVGEPFHQDFVDYSSCGPDKIYPHRKLGPGAITWSYTALAYEMLTGKNIFGNHSADTIMYLYGNEKKYNEYIKNELENSSLPEEAQGIFLQGFATEPAERFQTNGEITRALQDVYIPSARKTSRAENAPDQRSGILDYLNRLNPITGAPEGERAIQRAKRARKLPLPGRRDTRRPEYAPKHREERTGPGRKIKSLVRRPVMRGKTAA